jgi:hypothetical protein
VIELPFVKISGLSRVKEPVQEAFNAKPQTKRLVVAGMKKAVSIALILILTASSVLWVESSSAQAIPKPSVPEFTIQYIDNSRYVPATYSTDQYTGKTVIAEKGYYEQNKSVVLKIKNQPFSQIDEHHIFLIYQIQCKGRYSDYWRSFNESASSNPQYVWTNNQTYVTYPNELYTITRIGFSGNNDTSRNMCDILIDDISNGGEFEVKMQGMIGYTTRVYHYENYVPGVPCYDPTDPIPHEDVFTGETSEWSETQTVTINDSSVPNEILQLSGEQIALAVACVIIAILLVVIVLSRRRKRA